MRRLTGLSLLICLLAPATAQAQNARARISRGGVDGVEMSLEGGMVAPRGGALRWILTAYEVIGLSDLRPAEGATVHVATSLEQTEDAVEVTTDSFGRALIELAVPDDAPASFQAVLRLVHANGIQRRYELSVRVRAREHLQVQLARQTLAPGGTARAFGRLSDHDTGVGLGERTVRLTLRDGHSRPLAAPVDLTTDAAGVFAHAFSVPDDVRGAVVVDATTRDDPEHPVSARAQSTIARPSAPALLVAVAPERALSAAGGPLRLDVIVRNPEGRPMPGAVVTVDGANPDHAGHRATTDARGRAQLTWRAPTYPTGIHDVRVGVTANREGWGSGHGSAQVRVAASDHALAMAVEGGALVPSLGGRVWVRVVGPDGRPASAGVEVRASGPRLAQLSATTDASGIATLDATLRAASAGTPDRCGGETATAIDVEVGGARLATCLPLDPDAAARVRLGAPIAQAGGPIEVEVERVSAAARLPVELSVISPSGPAAILSTVLAAGERTTTLTLPEDVGGLVHVRARPLWGPQREVVRGGITGAWVVSSAPQSVQASLTADGTARVAFDGPATGERSAYVVAAPVDQARALADRLREATLGPLGDLRTSLGDATPALVHAAIAAHLSPDEAAPAILRGRDAVASPAPSDPASQGLLRDPWRSRARFVTGRLALIVRALEQYVATAIPERIDDVAVQGARGFTFNDQILASVAQSGQLGPEGATGLGGDALTIEQLQRFDRSLTYDNVARRITRERLFRLILALRAFVNQHGFDLPWSRLGNPSEWMRQLMGRGVPGVGAVQRAHLVDGWGRPIELRPARGGRSRFTFVDPLGAWEIVSAGPDGRFGTGDDQWDPTARVLRSGTPYADAVGEDVLVARLSGVELGRASVELLRGVEPRANAGYVPPQASAPARARAQALWTQLPSVLDPPTDPLGLRRPSHPGDGAGGTLVRLGADGGAVSLELDEEPRTWGAVVWSWTDQGFGSVALSTALAGSPVIVEADLPPFVRVREPVEVDVYVTNVSDAPLTLTPSATAEGLDATVPGSLTVGAGEAAPLTLRLAPGSEPGRGGAELAFSSGGERLRAVDWELTRVTHAHPMRLRAAGLARGRPWRVSWDNPEGARFTGGRVVVLAPSALAADPDLADLRERDPALVAFGDALAGRRSDPELWARLLRSQRPDGMVDGQDSMLSTACAAVAWASADRYDEDARAALARLRASLSRLGQPNGSDPGPDGIVTIAAALGALSAGGVPEAHEARALQAPVARLASGLRVALRRTIRNYPEEPSLLARAAAALLLADPRDAYGRAMLERAAEHLTETSDGGARVAPSERRAGPLESLAATAALAVAAHQVGDVELAERLTRGALARDHVALRAGGEAAFWHLAGGAYGALGEDAPRVTVRIDGQTHDVALESGRGVVELDASGSSHEIVVEAPEGGAFVRVEAAAARDFVTRARGPYELSIDGDVGDAIVGAGFELTVRATEETLEPTIVDLQLPAGVTVDDRLRGTLNGVGNVLRVEARDPAFVRVWLTPLGDGTEVAIPLPLRWTARGDLRGLGVIAYPLGRPEAMTSIAPRQLPVPAAER